MLVSHPEIKYDMEILQVGTSSQLRWVGTERYRYPRSSLDVVRGGSTCDTTNLRWRIHMPEFKIRCKLPDLTSSPKFLWFVW